MSSVPVPGLSGLLLSPSFEKDGNRRIVTLMRKPQVSIECTAFFGVHLHDVLSPQVRKRQGERRLSERPR